jgi:hypothetical protein
MVEECTEGLGSITIPIQAQAFLGRSLEIRVPGSTNLRVTILDDSQSYLDSL